jgi:hypothetical protein
MWIDDAIEKAGEPIDVDVEALGIGVETIQVIPLSAAEFNVLKSHPEVRSLTGDDRSEMLGLLMVCEMMRKADSEVTWAKMKRLPLTTLGALATAVTAAVGTEGALGE